MSRQRDYFPSTIQGEKVRLYQWLLMTLSSGVRLTQDQFETVAAAQEVEKELREHFADAIFQNRNAEPVNVGKSASPEGTK